MPRPAPPVCAALLMVWTAALASGLQAQGDAEAACAERRDRLVEEAWQQGRPDPRGALETAAEADKALAQCPHAGAGQMLEVARWKARHALGEEELAETHAERALELARALDDPPARIDALRHISWVRDYQGRRELARAALTEALEIAEAELGVVQVIELSLELGQNDMYYADFGAAFELLLSASTLAEQHASEIEPSLLTEIHHGLGDFYYYLGNYEQALQLYEEAQRTWDENLHLNVHLLMDVGICLGRLERYEEALAVGHEGLRLAHELGDSETIATLTHNVAYTLIRLGRSDDAVATAEEALALALELDGESEAAWGHKTLGLALAHVGEHERSVTELDRAQDIAQRANLPDLTKSTHDSIWRAAQLRGDYKTAFEHLLAYRELDLPGQAELSERMGELQTHLETAQRDRTIAELELAHEEDEAQLAREGRTRNLALAASGVLLALAGLAVAAWSRERRTHRMLAATHAELVAERALAEERQAHIKVLHGLLRICADCKRIRNDAGSWSQLEAYIDDHSEASFSHGLCPDCKDGYLEQVEGLPSGKAPGT